MKIEKRYTFNKTEKLKSRKLIEQLFSKGKSFSTFPFKIVYFFSEDEHSKVGVQCGVSASTKFFKKATDRNQIKRLTREAYRLQKTDLQNITIEKNKKLLIFFIYIGNKLPEYKLIFDKTTHILNRLIKLCNE